MIHLRVRIEIITLNLELKKNHLIILILGQAQRFGVREHDKILTINGKTPRNVDDAVGVIKQVQK